MGSITSVLGTSPRVAIIEVFSENPEEEFSVPEIVDASRISKRGAYIHVRKLLEEGIVRRSRKEGKCWYYRINENDPRGQVLPFLESVFTLGRLEREIKRDEGIPAEEPLGVPVTLSQSQFDFGMSDEMSMPFATASNVLSAHSTRTAGEGAIRRLRTEDPNLPHPLAAA